jgi:CMP-N-acetylneuraminic acid synthetase
MIVLEDRTVAALVPAQSGSKSIISKNLQELVGKPLVAWPIETAKKIQEIDNIHVTTEHDDITETPQEYGASVIRRPPELATDDSLVVEAIKHAIKELTLSGSRPDYLTLLEPTSPLRATEDVLSASLDLMKGTNL